MSYDATQVGVSILIDGIDIRQAYGFEPFRPQDRNSIDLDRRGIDMPYRHGQFSQGGTYKATPMKVRGWMPRANMHAFSRFLFRDTARPGRSKRSRSIIFWDAREQLYTFDTVESFSDFEFSDRWMHPDSDSCGVEFTILVTSAFPRQAAFSDFGLSGINRWTGSSQAGVSGDPAFLNVYSSISDLPARTHDDIRIKLGQSQGNPKLISCRTGPITDFDNGLKMIGNDGVSFDGNMFAGTELLTNHDFEDGPPTTGWTAVGTPTRNARWGDVIREFDRAQARVPSGNYVATILTDANGEGLRQDFATTSGKQYTVRVEVYTENKGVKIKFGKAGTDEGLVEKNIAAANRWVFYEFTMESLSTENYRIQVISNSAGNTSFFLNRVSVIESVLLNGSFEGTFVGGVAPDWSANGGTPTEETTTVHSTGSSTARKAQKMSFTSASSNYLEPSAGLTLTNDRLYYMSGWIRRTAGTGNLLIRNGSAGKTVNCQDDVFIPTDNVWQRFATIFDTFDDNDANFKPRFYTDVNGTDIIFDDMCLIELASGGKLFFEPGPFGKRVQVPIGQAILFEDGGGPDNNSYINAFGFTLACHFLPTFITDAGAPLIMKATRQYGVEASIRWDDNRPGCMYIEDDPNPSFYKLDGDQGADSTGDLRDFNGGYRGTRGICFKYDGFGILDPSWRMMLFYERLESPSGDPPNTLRGGIGRETEAPVPPAWPVAKTSYDRVILCDVGHWDAFWCYPFAKDEEGSAAECVAMEIPRHDNRIFEYGAAIADEEEIMIDLERGTVEKWDGTSLTNAFALVTGSLPELSGESPVIQVEGNISAIQILGKGNS